MKYLLDTHTFIWWHQEPEKLSNNVLKICENLNNDLFLSFASIWEMQIKLQLGKLKLKNSLTDILALQKQNGIQFLNITIPHLIALQDLPSHHKDPFDRLIIAQARLENFTVLSKDKMFEFYSVKTTW